MAQGELLSTVGGFSWCRCSSELLTTILNVATKIEAALHLSQKRLLPLDLLTGMQVLAGQGQILASVSALHILVPLKE